MNSNSDFVWDVCVIGKGLLGSAAARHLSEKTGVLGEASAPSGPGLHWQRERREVPDRKDFDDLMNHLGRGEDEE